MVSNQIILTGMTVGGLLELIDGAFERAVKKMKDEQPEKLLSPAETCQLFQISKVTLASWTKKGLLTDYRKGSRVFYKLTEVMASLTTFKKYKQN